MDILAPLARNTGSSMRVNHKVSTTAAVSNKQGDVQLMNFCLDGSNNLVIDVLICFDHIGISTITDTSIAMYQPMTISRNVLGSKSESTVMIMLLLVRRLHLQLCQLLAKFIPSFFVFCGSWLTNRRAITMRSSAQRRKLASRLSRGVELAGLVLTKTRLAMPSLILLPHAYASSYTVQVRRRVIKLASPCPLLNASCTALHMNRTAHPLAPHPLTPLSIWVMVPTA